MTGQSPPYSKTETPVHSMDALVAQRSAALAHDQCALSGVSIYAQISIGLSLYLYAYVSTPGYLSLLLTAPLLIGAGLLCLWLARQADPGQGVLEWALGARGGKIAGLLLALIFWLDAQLCLYALTAVVEDVLPDMNGLWMSLAVAALMALAIGGGDEYALPRLARFLRWVILAAFLYCALKALSYGNTGHLFPFWGDGAGRLFQGSLWMAGCLAGACCPLLLPPAGQTLPTIAQKRGILLRPLIAALGAGVATALVSAYLLPFYALARPETLGFRLLLVTHVGSSVAGWSLFLCAKIFLLLLALAAGVLRASNLVLRAINGKKIKPYLITALLFLQTPLAALRPEGTEELFVAVLPWRGAAALALLLVLWAAALIRRGKNPPGKEAAG